MGNSSALSPERRAVVEKRDRGLCVRCTGKGTDFHHRRSRRVRDKHTHCSCNGIMLCRTCHKWAHSYPLDAQAEGYIVSQWQESPGFVRVRGWVGWLEMDCVGEAEWKTKGP